MIGLRVFLPFELHNASFILLVMHKKMIAFCARRSAAPKNEEPTTASDAIGTMFVILVNAEFPQMRPLARRSTARGWRAHLSNVH